ncbi:MAG TPA: ABC transporter permease [Vicinamibacterales bacterium]|nr:ABC transporter permease [Vicinamibacterales bacterium]
MSATAVTPVTVIDSGHMTGSAWAELWSYRELLAFLVWRDLKVRYRQTALGVAWAVLQPLATMVVFAVFFGRLAKLPSDGVPYPVFVFAALVPWTYLAAAVSTGAGALITNQNLLTKVYFPRLLVPAAAVTTPLCDAALTLLLALVLIAWYGIMPSLALLVVPLLLVFSLLIALGASAWLSALTVRYRDVRYTLPFAIQLWLFVTPVAYPSSLIPAQWRVVYGLNPMTTVVDGFRWALLGTPPPPVAVVAASVAVTAALLAGGLWYFRREERSFADLA